MGLVGGIAIYGVIWWTVLFAVLPWWTRTQAEAGSVIPGTPESAPASHPFWRIATATTLVSFLVWMLVYMIIVIRPIGLDDWPF